jgi:hypothetical protein
MPSPEKTIHLVPSLRNMHQAILDPSLLLVSVRPVFDDRRVDSEEFFRSIAGGHSFSHFLCARVRHISHAQWLRVRPNKSARCGKHKSLLHQPHMGQRSVQFSDEV